MARSALSPTDRIAKVQASYDALAHALSVASAAQTDPDVSDVERFALWAVVEEHGATVHRQSRLLAGKSRGG